MPELPEVETVKNQLKDRLINQKILDVLVYHDNIIEHPSVDEFKRKIINQKINDVKRRGKWLLIELDDYFLLSHLRMEGKYNFKQESEIKNKHEHVVFYLLDGKTMRYQDTRKFGKMHLLEKSRLQTSKPLVDLGVEPFDEDFNAQYLKNKIKTKKLPIKTVLLDQSIVVGIGNIYVDEILFLSKIMPTKKAFNITYEECEKIVINTKEVLAKAIKLGGTTIRTFSSGTVHGRFQNELLVHMHENDPCPICLKPISKTKVGGRGTYYCSECQKKK